MSFGNGARRLCAHAGLLLGWRPDAFWNATPDELSDALHALRDWCGGGDDVAPVDREMLAALMETHPDGR